MVIERKRWSEEEEVGVNTGGRGRVGWTTASSLKYLEYISRYSLTFIVENTTLQGGIPIRWNITFAKEVKNAPGN